MNVTAYGTLALVVVTGIYVWLVYRQISFFRKFTLKQIRYQVEGDITQLRIKRADLQFDKGLKAEAEKILEYREEQCKKTIYELAKEAEK